MTEIKEIVSKVKEEISKTIFGHDESIELLVGSFLIGGHCLLEGPPGVGKTLLAKTIATSLGLEFSRIQFTPDLMPSDISGVNIFDQQDGAFRFAPGPIFADIVLADEINRTPPKTQSALLEAMEERFITIDGIRHNLGEFFFVIATQNPIEHEGTFPLPEAQLDRFLFKINLAYPESNLEEAMIRNLSSKTQSEGKNADSYAVVSSDEISKARDAIRKITIDQSISDYIQRLAAQTRSHPDLILGASPRAALYLALSAKFNAAKEDRDYCIPDDVKVMLPHVFKHRLVLQPEIYDPEEHCERLIQEILSQVEIHSG